MATGNTEQNNPLAKDAALNPQNVFCAKYCIINVIVAIIIHTNTHGRRPILSDNEPTIADVIAVPNNVVIGKKYVAAEKPNGSVFGNESGVAFGITKKGKFGCNTV